MRLASDNIKQRNSFHVYHPNGKLKSGLGRSFLRVMSVTALQVVAAQLEQEEQSWELYIESEVVEALKIEESTKCIVSFQSYKDGQHLAIARLYSITAQAVQEMVCHK